MMNKDEIGGNWKQFKGKAKEQWGKLTDDDMTVIEGKRDQLVGKNSGTLRLRERSGGKRSQRLGNPQRLPLVTLNNLLGRL